MLNASVLKQNVTCWLLGENSNLNRSIIFQCSSSHNKDFGIMVRGRGSFLCKGEEGVTVSEINESRNPVCYPTWLLFKQSCFDRLLSAATFWWCVSHGALEFLWIEHVTNVVACVVVLLQQPLKHRLTGRVHTPAAPHRHISLHCYKQPETYPVHA